MGTAMLPSYPVQVSNGVTFFLSIFHPWLVESVAVETTYWTVYYKLSAAICLSASESPRACYSTNWAPYPLFLLVPVHPVDSGWGPESCISCM